MKRKWMTKDTFDLIHLLKKQSPNMKFEAIGVVVGVGTSTVGKVLQCATWVQYQDQKKAFLKLFHDKYEKKPNGHTQLPLPTKTVSTETLLMQVNNNLLKLNQSILLLVDFEQRKWDKRTEYLKNRFPTPVAKS